MVNNEASADFRGILTMIRRAKEVPVKELRELGNDNPALHSLEVDRYTVGPRFFRYQSREREELHKRLLAQSFIDHHQINLNTKDEETRFRNWEAAAFPRVRRYFNDDLQEYHHNEYHFRGNFVVECFFILEVIRRFTFDRNEHAADGLSWIKLLLKARRDLIIYDNQLPFKVLEDLFYMVFRIIRPELNFLRLCIEFFSDCMLITDAEVVFNHIQQQRAPAPAVEAVDNLEQTGGAPAPAVITDFIDLVRKCHAPMAWCKRQAPENQLRLTPMRKVNYLKGAGMTIRASDSGHSVCSIQYSGGLLQIPRLRINYKSRHLLINLMEHEIQHYARDTFIIDYLHFMGSFIDTAEDVDVLVHNGIIVNLLSNSKEVAALLNSITKEAPFIASSYYYHGISVAVNEFCQIPYQRWRATLKRDYCSHPWMVASTIGAIILLVLTFIRTVCSIISIT